MRSSIFLSLSALLCAGARKMAGSGRKTHYRKQVTDAYLHGLPEPTEGQEIARVCGTRGSNILEVVDCNGEAGLAMLPTKFRKLIWVKRGGYVIVSAATDDYENTAGERGKVRHRVEHILTRDQIRHLRVSGKWPPGFEDADGAAATAAPGPSAADEDDGSGGDSDGDDDGDGENVAAMAMVVKAGAAKAAAGGGASSGAATDGAAGEAGEAEREGEEEEEEEEEESDADEALNSILGPNRNRLAMLQLRQERGDDDDISDDESVEESDGPMS
ncbi:unnamed protein product [Phaeothamnion confervicola]